MRNVHATGELSQRATIRKFRIVQSEGAREVDFYNLDAIIAVGYRANSYQATQFRIWATQTLRNFIVKRLRSASKAGQAIRQGLLR